MTLKYEPDLVNVESNFTGKLSSYVHAGTHIHTHTTDRLFYTATNIL